MLILRDYLGKPLVLLLMILSTYLVKISLDPKVSFVLDPSDLVRHDGNIWGIFHSHQEMKIPYQVKKIK